LDEIRQEQIVVEQRNKIDKLEQEKFVLKKLVKEQRKYNKIALEDKLKINNKLINIDNEIRGIKKKILAIGKEEKEKNLVEKILSLIRIK